MSSLRCPACGAALTFDGSPDGWCPACLFLCAGAESDHDIPPAGDGDDLPSGTSFGPFAIVSMLGRGGCATVYRAQERGLRRDVALKVFPADLLASVASERRFHEEAMVAASLEHPGIVPVYATGSEDGRTWLSMRLLSGGTLEQRLRTQRFAPERSIEILRCAADALDYAHARGVAHRDVKPSNLLLDESGRAFVADFGLAHAIEHRAPLARSHVIAGTPEYMSPEQALGLPVDARSDVYSLAIVACELLTGGRPFAGDSPVGLLMKHVSAPVPANLAKDLGTATADVIGRALAKSPEDRWPSAGAFVSALAPAVARRQTTLVAVTSVRGTRVAGPARVAALMALVVTTGAFLLTDLRGSWNAPPNPVASRHDVRLPPLAPPPGRGNNVPAAEPPEPVIQRSPSPDVPVSVSHVISGTGAVPPAPGSGPKGNDVGVASGENPIPTAEREPKKADDGQESIDNNTPPIDTEFFDNPKPVVPELPKNADDQAERPLEPISGSVETGAETTPPRIVTRVIHKFPETASLVGLQGLVRVRVTVAADGSVAHVEILKASHDVFIEPARRAVQQYRYEPAKRNGVPVQDTIVEEVVFRPE